MAGENWFPRGLGKNERNEALIEAVRKYPAVWNFTSMEYSREAHMKPQMWANICADIGCPNMDEAQSRWKSMLDKHREEKKLLKKPSGTGTDELINHKWPLMDVLHSFLVANIAYTPRYYRYSNVKRTKNTGLKQRPQNGREKVFENWKENEIARAPSARPASAADSEDFIDVESVADGSPADEHGNGNGGAGNDDETPPCGKRRKRKSLADRESEIDAELVKILKTPDTEEDAFGRTVALGLKKLTEMKKEQVKVEIQGLLYKLFCESRNEMQMIGAGLAAQGHTGAGISTSSIHPTMHSFGSNQITHGLPPLQPRQTTEDPLTIYGPNYIPTYGGL